MPTVPFAAQPALGAAASLINQRTQPDAGWTEKPMATVLPLPVQAAPALPVTSLTAPTVPIAGQPAAPTAGQPAFMAPVQHYPTGAKWIWIIVAGGSSLLALVLLLVLVWPKGGDKGSGPAGDEPPDAAKIFQAVGTKLSQARTLKITVAFKGTTSNGVQMQADQTYLFTEGNKSLVKIHRVDTGNVANGRVESNIHMVSDGEKMATGPFPNQVLDTPRHLNQDIIDRIHLAGIFLGNRTYVWEHDDF
jgi:hypothetical protein